MQKRRALEGYSNREGAETEIPAEPASLQRPGRRRKGLAIASLVFGIWGLVSLGLLLIGARVLLLDEVSWSRSVVGAVVGIIARVKADRNRAEYCGKRIAIAGIVTNSVSLVIAIVGLIATGRVFWYRT